MAGVTASISVLVLRILSGELLKAQKKREKEFLEEQDRKDEWERVLTGKKREQEISIAELKGIGPLGDFWQSYLGKSSLIRVFRPGLSDALSAGTLIGH